VVEKGDAAYYARHDTPNARHLGGEQRHHVRVHLVDRALAVELLHDLGALLAVEVDHGLALRLEGGKALPNGLHVVVRAAGCLAARHQALLQHRLCGVKGEHHRGRGHLLLEQRHLVQRTREAVDEVAARQLGAAHGVL